VVNGHKSAAHTDSPDGGTGKTCLGGGMHCPSASSCLCLQCSVACAHLESRLHGDSHPVVQRRSVTRSCKASNANTHQSVDSRSYGTHT